MLELLRSTDQHPTATWLYDELRKEFPTVSLGNVYRNLSILVEQGYVHKLDFGSTFDRYEAADDGQHAHFMCRNCGRIYDLPMPDLDDYSHRRDIDGHRLESARVEFFGVCHECAAEAESS